MTIRRLHDIKKKFPAIMEQSKGIISIACRKSGIEHKTYYNWRNKDMRFATKCDEVLDYTANMVELALLDKIDKGDTTAIIFYLKTKCKHRGYTERIDKAQVEVPSRLNVTANDEAIIDRAIQRRIAADARLNQVNHKTSTGHSCDGSLLTATDKSGVA